MPWKICPNFNPKEIENSKYPLRTTCGRWSFSISKKIRTNSICCKRSRKKTLPESTSPEDGIEKSNFSEATNSRGHQQFMYVFQQLQVQASKILPKAHEELGELIGIDGSLVNGTLSMIWQTTVRVQISKGSCRLWSEPIYLHKNSPDRWQ